MHHTPQTAVVLALALGLAACNSAQPVPPASPPPPPPPAPAVPPPPPQPLATQMTSPAPEMMPLPDCMESRDSRAAAEQATTTASHRPRVPTDTARCTETPPEDGVGTVER